MQIIWGTARNWDDTADINVAHICQHPLVRLNSWGKRMCSIIQCWIYSILLSVICIKDDNSVDDRVREMRCGCCRRRNCSRWDWGVEVVERHVVKFNQICWGMWWIFTTTVRWWNFDNIDAKKQIEWDNTILVRSWISIRKFRLFAQIAWPKGISESTDLENQTITFFF